jgi:hypothetical protein
LTRPFAADSPWNTQILQAPIAGNSGALVSAAEFRYGVVQKGTSLENIRLGTRRLDKPVYINTRIWTDPIVLSTGGNQVEAVCRQINLPPQQNLCGDGWEVPTLSVPSTGFPKPSYDGWLTVIDQNAGFAYDVWRARLTGSVMTYQFMRRWDLGGPGFLAPAYVSARGSGVPLFAGEILPHDILSGRIDHALAISVPGPAAEFYVQPASATDGNGRFSSLPEGARLRLKANFNVGEALHRSCTKTLVTECLPGGVSTSSARAILTALRNYGAFVVDRGAVPTLYAVPNYDWAAPLRSTAGKLLSPDGVTVLPRSFQNARKYGTPLLNGAAVSMLKMDDFDVVQLPLLYEFPPPPLVHQAGGYNGVAPQGAPGKPASASSEIGLSGGGARSGGVGVGLP